MTPVEEAGMKAGVKGTLRRTFTGASNANAGMIAAGISYYAFLALIPLLAVAVLIYGLVATPATVAHHVALLSANLPPAVAQLIGDQLTRISQGQAAAKGLGLLLALGIALFGARNAAGAIMEGLNMIAGRRETRRFFRRNAQAMGITLAGVAALALLSAVVGIAAALPGVIGQIGTLAVVAVAGAGGAAYLYRHGPDIPADEHRAIWPGAFVFAIGWVVATAGFGLYVRHFGNYGATYGSLGAVVLLLTWFYLSAWLLLIGAELNQSIRRNDPGNDADSMRSKSVPSA